MVEESLDDILRMLFYNAQSSIRSVINITLEEVMYYLLRKDGIEETLDAQKPSFPTLMLLPRGLGRGWLPLVHL